MRRRQPREPTPAGWPCSASPCTCPWKRRAVPLDHAHRIASHRTQSAGDTLATRGHACVVSTLQRAHRKRAGGGGKRIRFLISTLATTAASPTPWPWQQSPRIGLAWPARLGHAVHLRCTKALHGSTSMEKKKSPNAKHHLVDFDAICRDFTTSPWPPSSGTPLRPPQTPSAMPYQTHISGTTPARIGHPPVFLSAPYCLQPWAVWFRFCSKTLLWSSDPDIPPATLPFAFCGSFDTRPVLSCPVLCQPCTHAQSRAPSMESIASLAHWFCLRLHATPGALRGRQR